MALALASFGVVGVDRRVATAGGLPGAHKQTQGIVGLDARTGEVMWRSDPDRPGRLEIAFVFGGLIYGIRVPCGGGSVPSTLVAVDEESGEERWRTKIAADGAFDLQLIGPGGDAIVVIGPGETLRGLEPETGHPIWSVPLAGTSPIGGNDALVLLQTTFVNASPDGSFRPPIEPLKIEARSRKDGKVKWTYTLSAGAVGRDIAVGNRTIVFSSVGFFGNARKEVLYVLDTETGAERWSMPAIGHRFTVISDVVVAVDADGAHGFDAETGDRIWNAPPEVEGYDLAIGTSPRTALVLQRNFVAALDPADGSLLWNTATFSAGAPYEVGKNLVLIGTFNHTMLGVDARTGRVRWTRETLPPWTYSHAIGRRVVALGGTCNDN